MTETKEIVFRPLRRVKGKIVVASYMQWRRVKVADYGKFSLVIVDEYSTMPDSEYVYNHKGENLFFFEYNPANVPVFAYPLINTLEGLNENFPEYAVKFNPDSSAYYSGFGMDCDGVPCFTNYTAKEIAKNSVEYVKQTVPLTVGLVKHWLGWFLYQLDNSKLNYRTP